jgi:hypothetical protein
LKTIFYGKITKQAWLCLIPIGVLFVIFVCKLFCAESLRWENTVPFLISWLTQIGSGFFEEIVSRGVLPVLAIVICFWCCKNEYEKQ